LTPRQVSRIFTGHLGTTETGAGTVPLLDRVSISSGEEMAMTLEGNVVPSKHPEAAYRVYEGEAVVVMPTGGEVHVLNAVAARVWDLIDGRRTVDRIVEKIQGEFDVDPATAASDVREFVANLVERAIVSAGPGRA
jgi:hypothetical protein